MHILLVEDSDDDAMLLKEQLARCDDDGDQIQITHIDRLSATPCGAEGAKIDVVLLDLGLQDTQGIMTLERFQASSPDLPVVVLTGLDDGAIALRAVQLGAQDYLVKSRTESEVLIRALRYAIERFKLQDELKQTRLREREERQRREEMRRYFLAVHIGHDSDPAAHLDLPDLEDLAKEYHDLIMTHLQDKGDDDHCLQRIRLIVSGLVSRRARGGDLIQLHVRTVEEILAGASSVTRGVMTNHTRIVLVEVLSHLTDHYLEAASGIAA